jgi:phosphoglycerol transferase MdoB-like AlkP superfamily enzyme
MYSSLLFFHSIFRWLVLVSLAYAIFKAYRGYSTGAIFTKADNTVRHWTATISHIQLMIGFTLYFISPVIKYFLGNMKQSFHQGDSWFFGSVHMILMFVSIMVITFGSAVSKRKTTDTEKFKTMFTWFVVALLIIFISIPWPFSPLANRPYIRPF